MQVKLLDKDNIGLFFPYDPKTVAVVKGLPGKRFEPRLKAWVLAVDGTINSSLDRLKTAIPGVAIESRVIDRLKEFTRPVSPILKPDMADKPIMSKLYPYQREIVDFMLRGGSCLNASFVGAGKTLTSLAACETLGAKRVLVIVPKSVLMQWADQEIPKWLPGKPVTPVTGSLIARNNLYSSFSAGYMVIGYETARIDINYLLNITWDVKIADEAHKFANPRTQTYKALSMIRSKYTFGLTATPIMNKLEDVYGVMNWIRPGLFGNYYAFLNRYVVKDYWGGVKSYKNQDELKARIAPFIVRKSLEEANLQLPDKVETDIPVLLSNTETDLYDKIKKELLFDIEQAAISKIENPVQLQTTVVKIGKLFELCDSMELIGDSTQSSKLEVLKEHLEGTLVDGQKAIIITRFTRMCEILKRELNARSPLVITGNTDNRAQIIQAFEKGGHQILIGTEAIGQGLNLQVANILYNYDLPWNPAKLEQRIGRIHRQGQEKPVFVYNLVTPKTVETWLKKKIAAKKELSESLLPKTVSEIKDMLS